MMQLRHILTIWTACVALMLSSCKTDSVATGDSLLEEEDKIIVFADTVELCSQLHCCGSIISSPDSFLLGEMETPYGTLKADILTQLACPKGFRFPEGSIADSVVLYLTYDTWIGDDKSPLEIDVRLLDKRSLNSMQRYHSDIRDTTYCSMHDSTRVLACRQIITASESNDVINSTTHVVAFPLKDEFRDYFFSYQQYDDQDDFNNFFKGLYITSTFGGSSILNINSIQIGLYYHFSYEKAGRDTTVYDHKGFYANATVRQVNHFEYLENRNSISLEQKLNAMDYQGEDVCYVISPAGIYTRLLLPLKDMCNHIRTEMGSVTRRPYINRALLKMEVLNQYNGASDLTSADWAQPAENMLLIRESALDDWFERKRSLSDTCAINSSLSSETDSLGRYTYYYSYDLVAILTNALRNMERGYDVPDTLSMVLIPVDVKTSSSNANSGYYGYSAPATITAVRESQRVSNTVIRSTSNATTPLRWEVVYSGF